ncbi:MAG TPA: pyrroline-5-carboxylate reductase [Gammaproteobacteria bacterium]|nr:pyrroline-5-carboxylate reductase [Gammaproteobacteria bacterium]
MSATETILVIGFGNMGQALVRGWLACGRAASTIVVVEAMQAARSVAKSLGIATQQDLEVVTGSADVIVLAVKPNQLANVLPRCTACAASNAVVLSIAAGKTIAEIGKALGRDAAIVRAMPNTPAAIGKGMTTMVANSAVTPAQRTLCTELLAAVGAVAWLDDEAGMDAVTAISGSGPAYVFLLIECLEQAAIDLGLGAALARQLAVATVEGAGAYAAATAEAPAELRRHVTSPNGTTQAALDVLMGEPGMRELFIRAARAAAKRGRELASA